MLRATVRERSVIAALARRAAHTTVGDRAAAPAVNASDAEGIETLFAAQRGV
jgi:hypothetical protein